MELSAVPTCKSRSRAGIRTDNRDEAALLTPGQLALASVAVADESAFRAAVLLHVEEGSALLAPSMEAAGFGPPEFEVVRGSGGPAAVAKWRRTDGMSVESTCEAVWASCVTAGVRRRSRTRTSSERVPAMASTRGTATALVTRSPTLLRTYEG